MKDWENVSAQTALMMISWPMTDLLSLGCCWEPEGTPRVSFSAAEKGCKAQIWLDDCTRRSFSNVRVCVLYSQHLKHDNKPLISVIAPVPLHFISGGAPSLGMLVEIVNFMYVVCLHNSHTLGP